jgi:hypothetical protein
LAVSASAIWSALYTATNPTAAYYSPFTRFWELALGADWLEGMALVLDECVAVAGEGLYGPKSGLAKLIQYRAELSATTRKLFGDGFDIMLGELAGEITFDRD